MLSSTDLFSYKVALDDEEDRVTKLIPRFEEVRLDLFVVMDRVAKVAGHSVQSQVGSGWPSDFGLQDERCLQKTVWLRSGG